MIYTQYALHSLTISVFCVTLHHIIYHIHASHSKFNSMCWNLTCWNECWCYV